MAALLKIEHLEVRYGDLIGVADVSLEVPKGSVVALLGSNGAGKTTTLNAIAGIARVSGGSVAFDGENIAGQPAYAIVRKGLARTFQVPLTFESMSVLDNATIGALLRYPKAREARARARDVLQQVGLGQVVDAPARSLGTPGRKRLEIARALASEPKALLLDEAMAGLTPTEVREAIELAKPVEGIITDRFDIRNGNFGVRIAAAASDRITAIDNGTVVLSLWTPETGYMVELQHANNLLSVYKGLSQSLVTTGQTIRAGEMVGYNAEAEEGEVRLFEFELWNNGKPVDPEGYIVF